jgi:DNA-binding transcriptional LysR family regulator
MPERITITLQRAAVQLADSLTYSSAAERLHISEAGLQSQIAELERTLSFEIFKTNGQHVEVTDAGRPFIDACRTFLMTRDQGQN